MKTIIWSALIDILLIFFVHYLQSPFDDDTGRDDLNMTPG